MSPRNELDQLLKERFDIDRDAFVERVFELMRKY